jgi:hypothetical protein
MGWHMSDIKISSSSRAHIRTKARTAKYLERSDLVLQGAQSLFAEDKWVCVSSIGRALGLPHWTVRMWAQEKGSLIGNTVFNYQKTQRQLGVLRPRLILNTNGTEH